MIAAHTEAPEQYRARLRAQVRDTARAAMEQCAPNARGVWAAVLGISHGLLDRALARDGDKALHVADALAAPEAVRLAIAQQLIGDGRCVVDLPEAMETPDDLSLLARLVRESNATVEALITAAADARITADEGARLADAAHRSLAVTAAVRALGQRAVRNRGVVLRVGNR